MYHDHFYQKNALIKLYQAVPYGQADRNLKKKQSKAKLFCDLNLSRWLKVVCHARIR